MEFVVAEVERSVDRLEGLKVDVDLLLLALVGDDGSAVNDEAVGRNLGVELEPVLDRGDGAQDRQPVDSGLDVGRGTVLVGKHLADSADL